MEIIKIQIATFRKICSGAVLLLAMILFRCEGDRSAPAAEFINPLANPLNGPPAGNPDGNSPVPVEAGPIDVSHPDYIVGNGTPESCTAEAFMNSSGTWRENSF